MRTIIQRVSEARLSINNEVEGSINKGLLVLLGIEEADVIDDAEWLAQKIINLRIFADNNGLMNKSLQDINGEILIVSQFTLHASTKKGNRPSFIKAARPEQAIPLYNYFISLFNNAAIQKVATGKFGAMMQINLINDGPVTIIIDSKNKE